MSQFCDRQGSFSRKRKSVLVAFVISLVAVLSLHCYIFGRDGVFVAVNIALRFSLFVCSCSSSGSP